ncbi:hypothetical protein [Laceyella putida]|uniref:Secreted protein n=1 Tax=Laceyella putida TaxID=110101 RepID=A0ABW2RPC1_9BACL
MKIRKLIPVLFLFVSAFSLTILPATDAFATTYSQYYNATFSDSVWIGGGKVFKATDTSIYVTVNKSSNVELCYKLYSSSGTHLKTTCVDPYENHMELGYDTVVGKQYKIQIANITKASTRVSGTVYY